MRIATAEIAADLRGPQLCKVQTRAEIDAQIAELGPDPLRADADPEVAWRRIRRATRPIAALLMDQTILSGVGQRLPGRGALPQSGQSAPARPETEPEELARHLVRPRRVDADRRPGQSDRHGPARSTPRKPWVAHRAATIMAVRSTSTGGPAWRAGCADPRCGPRSSPGAICSGAAGASAGAELSLRSGRHHVGVGRLAGHGRPRRAADGQLSDRRRPAAGQRRRCVAAVVSARSPRGQRRGGVRIPERLGPRRGPAQLCGRLGGPGRPDQSRRRATGSRRRRPELGRRSRRTGLGARRRSERRVRGTVAGRHRTAAGWVARTRRVRLGHP